MNWYLTRIMATLFIGLTIVSCIIGGFMATGWCKSNNDKDVKEYSKEICLEGIIEEFEDKYEVVIDGKTEKLQNIEWAYQGMSGRGWIPDIDDVWRDLKVGMYLKINDMGLAKIATPIIIPPANISISNETTAIWSEFESLNEDGVDEAIENRLFGGVCFSIVGIVILGIIGTVIISAIACAICDYKPEPRHCKKCSHKIRDNIVFCSYCGTQVGEGA